MGHLGFPAGISAEADGSSGKSVSGSDLACNEGPFCCVPEHMQDLIVFLLVCVNPQAKSMHGYHQQHQGKLALSEKSKALATFHHVTNSWCSDKQSRPAPASLLNST